MVFLDATIQTLQRHGATKKWLMDDFPDHLRNEECTLIGYLLKWHHSIRHFQIA